MNVLTQAEPARTAIRTRTFDVVAMRMPIVYNEVRDNTDRERRWVGHHDHDGLIYALAEHREELEALRARIEAKDPEASRPHPLVRPLVLRACRGEEVAVRLTNLIRDRRVGMHLAGGTFDATDDGAHVGRNRSSLAAPGEQVVYRWRCPEEGVFSFSDLGDPGGDEQSTNAHGLFGALIVEPEGAWFSDPTRGPQHEATDGLYVDVHLRPRDELLGLPEHEKTPFCAERPPRYAPEQASFREYVLFIHDEPAAIPPHTPPEEEIENPVPVEAPGDEHDHEVGSLMCFNYRAEPMANREPWIWRRLRDGTLDETVVNEEQHHSSWMFGDPCTPVLKAYLGDPIRIRLVHAGVKETHVFHLHLYGWHDDPDNHRSPVIDAISITPQTGHTIVPLYGAGNVQSVPGDAIFHCHLYPHFHMGMWGIMRAFDTEQEGVDGPSFGDRTIGRYPDGTRIERLAVLPDRQAPPPAMPERPGFPLFIPGRVGQKSPRPPWPGDGDVPEGYDYRPATALERAAFNADPKPGEMFTRFPSPSNAEVDHDIVASRMRIEYNDDGWHDPDGHVFHFAEDEPAGEPLFFRCRTGETLNLTLHNRLPENLPQSAFDLGLPPGPEILVDGRFPGECGLHVHMVKFDPLVADGASTGWNYLSAPAIGRKLVYRWWADEELGTIFCHDHLFANTRQRHGLYGALIVEPEGATFHDPRDLEREIVTGREAAIRLPDGRWFREACIGIADWVAMYDRDGTPLEAPEHVPSHDDNGVMAVNHRCAPLRERGDDPARWFAGRDPDTGVIETRAGDPLWIRLVQGSHEEQHSFQVHGTRWRRFWTDPASPMRNQQTLGISEAFTFVLDQVGPGDHLIRLSSIEDTWLGCWTLLRAHEDGPLPALPRRAGTPARLPEPPPWHARRRFRVVARDRTIFYRDDLADPFGLVYEATAAGAPGEALQPLPARDETEPLVLRCRQGEWVEIELVNDLPAAIEPEPCPPRLPVEGDRRAVSSEVSLHADLVGYDVREHDGANVGRNPRQSVAPGERRTLLWYADVEPGAVLLQDLADVRNHRHHGLVGALVVEPSDSEADTWTGARATIDGVEEMVLILQDGLRYFTGGVVTEEPNPPDAPEEDLDTEDQGHKAFNYRSERLDALLVEEPSGRSRALAIEPATPVFEVPAGAAVRLHLVVAADKPRNHSFVLHGHGVREGALTSGVVRTYELTASETPGDYAYRSGVHKWAIAQGLWGVMRVMEGGGCR
jgi:FtsP/CotA-like multicopper oxidase with cupredoxin domain